MEPQSQQSLDEFRDALRKIVEGWTVLKNQDQAVRNLIYTETHTHLLSRPADMPQYMAEAARYCTDALGHLNKLGL